MIYGDAGQAAVLEAAAIDKAGLRLVPLLPLLLRNPLSFMFANSTRLLTLLAVSKASKK